MEEYLNKFRSLLKSGLKENYEIEKNESIENLSIIDEYTIEELYDEMKFLVETLLMFKKTHKRSDKPSKRTNSQESHVHLIDLSSEKNLKKIDPDLKKKLKEIQKKYIMKISKALKVDPITISPMSLLNNSKDLLRNHARKSSNFKSLNLRHPGTKRNDENYRRYLKSTLAQASSNVLLNNKKKFTHGRASTEYILC